MQATHLTRLWHPDSVLYMLLRIRYETALVLQVPIMYTIYLNSSFQKFTKLAPDSEAMQPGFFDLPPGYRPKTIDEVMQKRQQQAIEAAEQHAADGNDSPLHLDLTEEELHAMQHS